MQTVILCGGMGTRAYPLTRRIPKALMPVDERPILEHVMQIYALHGHTDFILSLGYLKEAIIEYFTERKPADLHIEFVDTGTTTDTGGRVAGCAHLLDDTFFVTYCDGLADIDLDALLAQHQRHTAQGGLVTVTAVPLRSQYGILMTNGNGQITGFQEKPILPDYWINGGFFVFNKEAFDHWHGDNLERDVLPHLADLGVLYSYRHTGFWKSMDTYKDQQKMNELWPPVLAHLHRKRRPNTAEAFTS